MNSYGSIYNMGHKALEELFDGPVTIEEKVDGSQFSFGVYGGEFRCRSKGVELVVDAPEGMFKRAVESSAQRKNDIPEGWTVRGEYLQKPKHNSLAYSRTPVDHIVVFDVDTGDQSYIGYAEKRKFAESLGYECVPLMQEGEVKGLDEFVQFMERESFLGGCKIEGVVVKNYAKFGPDKKVLMGKHVSEAFKEIHQKEWKRTNPGRGDVVQDLINSFATEARWRKAVQHLREDGSLQGDPRDIGNLIKEVQRDIHKEAYDMVAETLAKWAMPQIVRRVTAGLPEWYKNQLLESQFGGNE